jgi:fused signal recognition particle receptor
MGIFSFFTKDGGKNKETLDKGLEKTKTGIFTKLSKAIIGKSKVDEEVLDELESILIGADVGAETTIKVIQRIEERVKKDKYLNSSELDKILRDEISQLLVDANSVEADNFSLPALSTPYVLLVVGVNGVGKTTTIGKLANQYYKLGKKVILGAGDTFRAAAVDQLKIWGQRVGVPVIARGMNTDPASVAFDAVKQAIDEKADLIIIDTAGRLQTKVNLMNELTRIKKVIQKLIPEAPHEVLLVLDGSTGQNAIVQAREFMKATDVNALAITKLDGTAKGGVVIGISDTFKIPVKYIGVGEGIDDLQIFNRREFVDSLFKSNG